MSLDFRRESHSPGSRGIDLVRLKIMQSDIRYLIDSVFLLDEDDERNFTQE
jgi:hypothetical protein